MIMVVLLVSSPARYRSETRKRSNKESIHTPTCALTYHMPMVSFPLLVVIRLIIFTLIQTFMFWLELAGGSIMVSVEVNNRLNPECEKQIQ